MRPKNTKGKAMNKINPTEMILALKEFDTPAITNVIGSYPGESFCLDLYDPWKDNWYTDQSIRCMFPDLGRTVGYAVTCIYGLPEADKPALPFIDLVETLEDSLKPTIFVFQQDFPSDIAGKVGLAGGVMTTTIKAVGCVGALSNGPSRDIDEIRPMNFQYMLSGTTAGHGDLAIKAINVTVTVAGMEVNPGEIIHMDENGACKFPADKLQAVLDNVRKLREEEAKLMDKLSKAKSAAEIRKIFDKDSY
jgi:4-hydroxy-4-methyl-2-oxoglutarate aldolase